MRSVIERRAHMLRTSGYRKHQVFYQEEVLSKAHIFKSFKGKQNCLLNNLSFLPDKYGIQQVNMTMSSAPEARMLKKSSLSLSLWCLQTAISKEFHCMLKSTHQFSKACRANTEKYSPRCLCTVHVLAR